MGGVTEVEFARLRKEVAETRLLVETMFCSRMTEEGRKQWTPEAIQGWLAETLERREFNRAFGPDGVWGNGLISDACFALVNAGMPTLYEVAAQPRSAIAALPGVGRVSIARLEAAMGERDLSWEEAV